MVECLSGLRVSSRGCRCVFLRFAIAGVFLVCGDSASLFGQADTPKPATEKPAAEKPAEKPVPKAKTKAKIPKTQRKEEADGDNVPENPFPNRTVAPGLDGGVQWLNASGPISIKDVRGKVVLLDFWTYCCINCMHVLPDLKFLEKKYAKELVVIGVHSAKFDNEKESENIRRAVMRYEIEHPVVNDAQMSIWRKFGVRAWPTIVLVDPEGFYCGHLSGEGNREVLDKVLEKVIAYHKAKGTLDETPIRFDLEREKVEDTPLRFPGKILADEAGDRLFISDSNHNRIVVASLDGKLKEIIGTGAIGKANGPYDKASFDHPQGMALHRQKLYVADTENHLIREVDLEHKAVKTIAGTGEQSHRPGSRGGPARTTDINSPWDLLYINDELFIAMAGPHQIWVLDHEGHTIKPYAGSGREDIANGPLSEAALAQPSGITTDGKAMYVVDSEGSAVRRIPIDGKGVVTTIVGTSDLPQGRCLFEFGDRDGIGADARLQHPLGIVFHDGQLYVADSYNHKIRRVNLEKQELTTFLGDGEPGLRDDPPRFSEPAGLAVAGNTLFVADTNNHLIRKVDLATSKVTTMTIVGLTPPQPAPPSASDAPADKGARVAAQRVQAGESLHFEVTLELPPNYKLNKLAPLTYRVAAPEAQGLVSAEHLGQREQIEAPEEGSLLKFSVPLAAKTGKGELHLTLTYGYCRDGVGGLCKLGTATWIIPVEVAADGETAAIKLQAAPKSAPATDE